MKMSPSTSRIIDELVDIEIRERIGFFRRSPTAYLRELDVSDESIWAAMQFDGPKTAIRAADAASLFGHKYGKEAARCAWSYLMEAIELSRKPIRLDSVETVIGLVDKLYEDKNQRAVAGI